ncbi:hypothetical protein E2C01_078850 [Portunus trituberculatus]|uniref:Uncharacterized protein n=1 Tax=Portunus trituberculatus TaxID=210409 RepID=A0A5B7INY4_PORTR|nr:hypothetical protein [Portunus trituberculatus]
MSALRNTLPRRLVTEGSLLPPLAATPGFTMTQLRPTRCFFNVPPHETCRGKVTSEPKRRKGYQALHLTCQCGTREAVMADTQSCSLISEATLSATTDRRLASSNTLFSPLATTCLTTLTAKLIVYSAFLSASMVRVECQAPRPDDHITYLPPSLTDADRPRSHDDVATLICDR